jgi:hypothetical protein
MPPLIFFIQPSERIILYVCHPAWAAISVSVLFTVTYSPYARKPIVVDLVWLHQCLYSPSDV